MDDLIAEPGELSGHEIISSQVSDQDREIKKWHAISRMVEPDPDVLPFSLSTTGPERLWAFFTRASVILQQSEDRAMDEVTGISEATVDIF